MTVHTPIWMQPVGGDPDINYSGQELRQLVRAVNAIVSAGVLDTQGAVGSAAMKVTQRGAGANFSVDVAAGHAYIVGDDVSAQGTYFCWNDGTVNVVTPSAPASGTRVHRLVLQIQDKLNNGTWTGYTAALTLLQDTGAGTPAEPNSALTLALISIAAGQASVLNANITDSRSILGGSTWQRVATGLGGPGFQNGWTDRGGQYPSTAWRLLPDGDVEINIHATPGTLANSTALWAMPTAYIPAHTQIMPVTLDMSTFATSYQGYPTLLVRGSGDTPPGAVQCFNLPGVTANLHNASARYSLTGT